jgi:hypothetical protein
LHEPDGARARAPFCLSLARRTGRRRAAARCRERSARQRRLPIASAQGSIQFFGPIMSFGGSA